jgi:hypothetical protein
MTEEQPTTPASQLSEEEFHFNSLKLSSQRSPFFYVDLATRYLRRHETLEISGLGQGILYVLITKPF